MENGSKIRATTFSATKFFYYWKPTKPPWRSSPRRPGVLTVKVEEGETVEIGALIGEIDTSASAPAGAASPAAEAAPAPEASAPAPAAAGGGGPAAPDPMHLSPAVRRVVDERGVNPAQVAGTGRGGRLTKADVMNAPTGGASAPAPSPAAPVSAPAPRGQQGTTERVKMTTIRKKIAERLVQAQQDAAILTTFNEVDMSQLMALRKEYKDSFEKKYGVRLGFMGFFVKAAIQALRDYPAVNAMIDGTDIIYHNYNNIGIAVSSPKGLVVPVLKNAELMSLAEIELSIRDYALKARDGKITIDDMSGGTFTISNGGVFGSLMSTPILNPPQSGILGMHKIEKRPIVVDDQVVVRPMMYLALSYDHRMIDGKESVSFLVRIKECIEDPARLIMEI